MLFATKMYTRKNILLLVNKDFTGERKFQDSIMWTTELPAIRSTFLAHKGSSWKPAITVVDLTGNCKNTKPVLQYGLGYDDAAVRSMLWLARRKHCSWNDWSEMHAF